MQVHALSRRGRSLLGSGQCWKNTEQNAVGDGYLKWCPAPKCAGKTSLVDFKLQLVFVVVV